jgi:hypothetical protein
MIVCPEDDAARSARRASAALGRVDPPSQGNWRWSCPGSPPPVRGAREIPPAAPPRSQAPRGGCPALARGRGGCSARTRGRSRRRPPSPALLRVAASGQLRLRVARESPGSDRPRSGRRGLPQRCSRRSPGAREAGSGRARQYASTRRVSYPAGSALREPAEGRGRRRSPRREHVRPLPALTSRASGRRWPRSQASLDRRRRGARRFARRGRRQSMVMCQTARRRRDPTSRSRSHPPGRRR